MQHRLIGILLSDRLLRVFCRLCQLESPDGEIQVWIAGNVVPELSTVSPSHIVHIGFKLALLPSCSVLAADRDTSVHARILFIKLSDAQDLCSRIYNDIMH